MPDSRLDLGVMRIGDVRFDDTKVDLQMDMIQPDIDVHRKPGRDGSRSLLDVLRERILQATDLVDGDISQEEKDAIGTIISEGK